MRKASSSSWETSEDALFSTSEILVTGKTHSSNKILYPLIMTQLPQPGRETCIGVEESGKVILCSLGYKEDFSTGRV